MQSEQEPRVPDIVGSLSQVIDPETGSDVVRMGLVQNLAVSSGGMVIYTFRPSSPTCPLAAVLAYMVRDAVSRVAGVLGQRITVVDHVDADELTQQLSAAS